MSDNNTGRTSRFITSRYSTLFELPEGEGLTLHFPDGHEKTVDVKPIDSYHVMVDNSIYHVCQYAEMCENVGIITRPASVSAIEDGPDYYEVFQIPVDSDCRYLYRSYGFAKKNGFCQEDYRCVYAGYLTPEDTLEGLFARHNTDNRPATAQMQSMSVSDVIIIHKTRRGSRQYGMYYVDSFGFKELLAPRDEGFMR